MLLQLMMVGSTHTHTKWLPIDPYWCDSVFVCLCVCVYDGGGYIYFHTHTHTNTLQY